MRGMMLGQLRVLVNAVIAYGVLQFTNACASHVPLEQKFTEPQLKKQLQGRRPDCLKDFAPYCEKNGFRACPEYVAASSPATTGSVTVDWKSCKSDLDRWLARQQELRAALDRLHLAELATIPACTKDITVPSFMAETADLAPDDPNPAASLVVRGYMYSGLLLHAACAQQVCQWEVQHRPGAPTRYCADQ